MKKDNRQTGSPELAIALRSLLDLPVTATPNNDQAHSDVIATTHPAALYMHHLQDCPALSCGKCACGFEVALHSLRVNTPPIHFALSAALTLADEIIGHALSGGCVDGGEIQERAAELGLLKPFMATKSCGEFCNCASVDDSPVWCFRKTYLEFLPSS